MLNPDSPIARLSLLTETERQSVLQTWNTTKMPYPAGQCYHELFEEQVRRTPEALAVVDGEMHLSYDELNQRANRLAHYLVQAGVGPDVLVALLAERGWQLLTAMLAVFKTGGAYLPLDPTYPPARLLHILEHSRAYLTLTTSEFMPLLCEIQSSQGAEACIAIECILQQEQLATSDFSASVMSHHLAYVIYTSGSTGQPKGAMLEQRGMINHLCVKIRDLNLDAGDRVAQTASQCFDISVWQMLAPLLVGASVEIFPTVITRDPVELLRQVAGRRITILEIVPALLQVALASLQRPGATLPDLAALRWLLLTGEALPPELIQHWFACYPHLPHTIAPEFLSFSRNFREERAEAPRAVAPLAESERSLSEHQRPRRTATLLRPTAFIQTVDRLLAEGHTFFVEMGPGSQLTQIIRRSLEERAQSGSIISWLSERSRHTATLGLLRTLYLSGFTPDWSTFYRRPPRALELPRYPWLRERYWLEEKVRSAS